MRQRLGVQMPLPTGLLDSQEELHDRFAQIRGNAVKSLQDSRFECCGLFWFFLVVPILFVGVYHLLPTAVLFAALACFLAGLAPLVRGASLLAGSLTAVVLAYTMGGLYCYYAYMQPMRTFQDGRTYVGVYASQPAVAFADAAVVSFAGDAVVDNSKSLGFTTLEGGVNTYCVAPVVDSESNGRVEFWAIGLNCCGKIANFECDHAGEPSVHDGFVIPDARDGDVWFDTIGKHFAPSLARRDLFMKAVTLAESVHGVVSSTKPIMVHWGSRSRADLITRASVAISLIMLAACLVSICAAMVLSPMVKQLRDLTVAQVAEARQREPERDPGPPLDFHRVVLQCFVMPFLAFVFCVVLVSWSHCSRMGDLLMGVFQIALAAAAVVLLASQQSFRHGVLVVLAVVVGAYVGHRNYLVNSLYYCSVISHRSYSNVRADAKAIEYQDAGKMHFAEPAKLGVNKSFGFLYRGVTYCAAPILPSACAAPTAGGAAAPCEVHFWAVNVDCCGHRGDFACVNGAEWDGSALALNDIGQRRPVDERRRNYLRAVRAAGAAAGLLIPQAPMLLRAAQNDGKLDVILQEWKGRAIGVCLLASALAFLALAGLAFLSVRWERQKEDQRRRAGGR